MIYTNILYDVILNNELLGIVAGSYVDSFLKLIAVDQGLKISTEETGFNLYCKPHIEKPIEEKKEAPKKQRLAE